MYYYFSLGKLHFRYVSNRRTLRDAQCHTTTNFAPLGSLEGLGMACCYLCSSSAAAKCRCGKDLDSPWSWLVCFSATFIIVLTLGISLNFGVLFPVLMVYFQESRERIGKFIERFSIECRKTKTKPVSYQLDYSPNLKP